MVERAQRKIGKVEDISAASMQQPFLFFFATTHFGYYLPTAEQYSKLQKKRARNSVPKCPCKLLQPADRPMAGSSSLEGHFGTGLCTRFSSAWSNVECGSIIQFHHSQHLLLLSKQVNVQGRQSELKIGSCTRCSPKPSHNFQGRAGSLVLV